MHFSCWLREASLSLSLLITADLFSSKMLHQPFSIDRNSGVLLRSRTLMQQRCLERVAGRGKRESPSLRVAQSWSASHSQYQQEGTSCCTRCSLAHKREACIEDTTGGAGWCSKEGCICHSKESRCCYTVQRTSANRKRTKGELEGEKETPQKGWRDTKQHNISKLYYHNTKAASTTQIGSRFTSILVQSTECVGIPPSS